MDRIKWEEKIWYDRETWGREEDAKEEEEAFQTEIETATEEKEDKVLSIYFHVNNKCLL